MNTYNFYLSLVHEKLSVFAKLEDFWHNFDLIYGNDYDAVIAEALRSSWVKGDFSDLPVIEVVSADILGPAWGGYGASNNTIYLSESLLASGSPELIVAVLLEEIGHYVDALVNAVDTPGDEGELFALRVQGITVDPSQLERIRANDDHGTITVNGEEVAIEMATGTTISTAETTVNNDLKFEGVGTGTGGLNNGVLFTSTGSASSTGTGTITVIGQGSPDGTEDNNAGVRVEGKVTSVDGAISVTGTGGSGKNFNIGVNVVSGGEISSTGMATITVLGQGSTTTNLIDSTGVRIGGTITSVDGAISVTGTGGSGVNSNSGVSLLTSGKISSTGTATITVLGQGSTTATGVQNYGVWVNGAITSVDGAISVTGTGGSGSIAGIGVTATNLVGVLVQNGGSISSTGKGDKAATITINGQGSTTAKDGGNFGVGVIGTNSNITSIDGAISVTGIGGSGAGQNIGLVVSSSGTISSTGTGENAATITVNGQGSTTATGSLNQGVRLTASITSADGAITINGTGGSGTESNSGVALRDGSILSTGKASVTITGVGGAGTASDGIRLESNTTGSTIQTNSGDINLVGTASNDNFGINLLSGTILKSTGGSINLLSDSSSINLDNPVIISSKGDVSINRDNDKNTGSTIVGSTVIITANILFLNDIIKFDYNDDIDRFDTIDLTGGLDLSGSSLNLDSTNLKNPVADTFYTLIDNDGTDDAVIGTFQGLKEGDKVGTIDGHDLVITYQGGDGNDVGIHLRAPGDSNQAPTDLSLDSTSIDENVSDNSFVGTFSSIDPNDGDTFTYSFVDGDGDTDNNAFTIASDRLTINQSPNFEGQSNYNIRVRTSDQGGLFFDKELTITINNLDEVAPTITSDGTATAINENSGGNQVVYTVTSTDNGDIVTGATTYSLKNVDDFAAFSIDSTSGQVKLIANPDFETKPNYSFTVVATDAANNFSEQAVTLTVNDLPELGKNLTNKSDIYFGRMAPELIYALAGNDFVYGQGGNDSIYGGIGNDFLFGGLGNDLLNGEEGNDVLSGGFGEDFLNGGTGNDRLFGDWGNDVLDGGAGRDYLTGGFGADIFRFQFGESNLAQPDHITDFTFGIDKISLPTGIPTNFSRAADSAAASLTNLVNGVFADANGAIAGAQALAVNSAALVRATRRGIAGTYLIINDGTAGFDPVNDLVINLTGAIGTWPQESVSTSYLDPLAVFA
ncbi:cadherin domain-containing protein [Synechocystis sp. CACIAM 05]|uniref:cadherin domain-containing protein n=1 Tax=Synechocystis sp. CACIAM 05 TaxID=1933929 RepID=UPI00138E639E|nr:cadherin domain-containing protein [Synechocystis sp. CACIAM 05]QHU98948.1 hypothetical protein BWK47_01570 [Synechocystis sp. CACIAM 05]